MYRVVLDNGAIPPMYGIVSANGAFAGHISTDYQEVNHLAQCFNRAELSPIHLGDVVEDFCRG